MSSETLLQTIELKTLIIESYFRKAQMSKSTFDFLLHTYTCKPPPESSLESENFHIN